jgi:hypothetical protein
MKNKLCSNYTKGRHEELLATPDGVYAQMWGLQQQHLEQQDEEEIYSAGVGKTKGEKEENGVSTNGT